jgi:hypothetical protein
MVAVVLVEEVTVPPYGTDQFVFLGEVIPYR